MHFGRFKIVHLVEDYDIFKATERKWSSVKQLREFKYMPSLMYF